MSNKDDRQESMEYWRTDIGKIKEDSTHGSIYLWILWRNLFTNNCTGIEPS
jgi:hypothetical protein